MATGNAIDSAAESGEISVTQVSSEALEPLIRVHSLGRPLVGIVFYNNGESVPLVLSRIPRWQEIDVVLHDDCSTDGTYERLERSGYTVLRTGTKSGLGYSIRSVIRHAHQTAHQVVVILAGNNKDDPGQVPDLLAPIYRDGYDYVQGSRRLQGGEAPATPLFRRVMIPLHARLVSWMTGFPCTDALNGFRAYRIGMFFEDQRLNIWQDWLDHYELETYIHYNVLRSGYRAVEVPVSKSYSHFQPGMKMSHIRPLQDWWSILRPLLLLRLGLRR